jgi:manganese-dependent inorganic pyrophosphatase
MEKFERKIWVIGHKNPDTDSICSAIAYANLKCKLEGNCFEAKRAGNINQETAFVLNYFGVEEPELVTDVGTQVRDVEFRRTEGISENISLKKAWELMKEKGVVTLPILKKKRLLGVITIADIANSYMNVYDNNVISRAGTSIKNLVDTLDGELVVGDAKAILTQGKVLIAAANPDLMENYIEPHDLVILGNRYESQLCAIEMNAGVIVVCEGAPVSITIKKLAEERGCIIVSTKYDTFTAARLINQSMPVGYFMTKDNLVCFQMDDPVEEISEIMANLRHRDFPIQDAQGFYQGMISRRNLLGMKQKQIILVDHNERTQAADGVEHAEILEIIDHHRLGTIETMAPIFFRNQPVGCTATIIYQMYEQEKVPIDKKMAGLLCSAIISDTLLFRSPTCTEVDRVAATKLATIAGINLERFAQEMFTASSNFASKTPDQIFHQDFKEFVMGDYKVGIGQINSMNKKELDGMKPKMKEYLPQALGQHGVNLVIFMMTSIMDESSDLLVAGAGAEELVEKAFGTAPENGELTIPGMVSRKKQMVPALTLVLQH